MIISCIPSATCSAHRGDVILSQTAIYALRASLWLAAQDPSEKFRVDDIADELDVPRNYLSKILHVLAREGVLTSSRGPGGGFQLARSPREVTLAEVVDHFDPLPEEAGCLLGRAQCSDRDPCAAHHRWKHISGAVHDFFRHTSIADLSPERVASLTHDKR